MVVNFMTGRLVTMEMLMVLFYTGNEKKILNKRERKKEQAEVALFSGNRITSEEKNQIYK